MNLYHISMDLAISQCEIIGQDQARLVSETFPWTAVTGFASGIPECGEALRPPDKAMSHSRSFYCCAVRPRRISSGISTFLPRFIRCRKTTFPSHPFWATCLCQHTINCPHSLADDLVRPTEGLFPISSSIVDDKPIRTAELQDFVMFSSRHHLHLTLYPCSLELDLKPWPSCVRLQIPYISSAAVQSSMKAFVMFLTMALTFPFLWLVTYEFAAVNQYTNIHPLAPVTRESAVQHYRINLKTGI